MAVKKKKTRVVLEGLRANARVVMTDADRLVAPRVSVPGAVRVGSDEVSSDEVTKCGSVTSSLRHSVTVLPRPVTLLARSFENMAAASQTFATDDPCDRAHLVRGGAGGFLVSAVGLSGGVATPRRYPRCAMHEVVVGEVVSSDEVTSDGVTKCRTHSVTSSLRHCGEGGVTVLRIVERAVAIVSDETVFDETFAAQCRLAGALGAGTGKRMAESVSEALDQHPRLRDILKRRPFSRESAKAVRLEAEADRLLIAAGFVVEEEDFTTESTEGESERVEMGVRV